MAKKSETVDVPKLKLRDQRTEDLIPPIFRRLPQLVLISKIINFEYNPAPSESVVEEIQEDFQPDQFEPVILNLTGRPNEYVVEDGHNRIEAAVRAGHKKIPAWISQKVVKSRSEQTELFDKRNKAKATAYKSPIKRFIMHRGGSTCPKVIAISKTLNKYGCRVDETSADYHTQAVDALYLIESSIGGLVTLDLVLYVISNVFNCKKGSLKSDILKGLAYFIYRYKDRDELGDLDIERLISILRRNNLGSVTVDIKIAAAKEGGIKNGAIHYFRSIYNEGLAVKNRID